MTRAAGCCPACRRLMTVYSCVCGCGLSLCHDCLNRLSFGGDGSVIADAANPGRFDGKFHEWRIVAEISAYPPGGEVKI